MIGAGMGRGGGDKRAQAAPARAERLAAPGDLGEEELDALDGWCGDEAPYLVNSYLRAGGPERSADDEQAAELARWYIERLDRALARAPRLGRGLTVYRGIGSPGLAAVRPGDVLPEPGYAAASLERERAEVFASGGRVLELRLSPGTPVLAIGEIEGIHRYRHEREVLLPRGGAYRITGERDGLLVAEFRWSAR